MAEFAKVDRKTGKVTDLSPTLIEPDDPEPFYDLTDPREKAALLRKYPITRSPRDVRPSRA